MLVADAAFDLTLPTDTECVCTVGCGHLGVALNLHEMRPSRGWACYDGSGTGLGLALDGPAVRAR